MGADHSTALTFNLEETVWLDQGQRMKELLSLALEPEIHIEERQEYVAIKGGLRLKGEYLPAIDNSRNQSEKDIPPPQYPESNESREDGVGEIRHYFPVDVTIPLRRIHNLEDVYVQIDGFDYDLPESDCIQLTADVSITGMRNEDTAESSEKKEDEEEPIEMPDPMPEWNFERKAKPEDEDKEEGLHSKPSERVKEDRGDLSERDGERKENQESLEITDTTEEKEQLNDAQTEEETGKERTRLEDEKTEDLINEVNKVNEDTDASEEVNDEGEISQEDEEEINDEVSDIVTSFHSRLDEQENASEVVEKEDEREEVELVTTEEEGNVEADEEKLNSDKQETEEGRDENALYLTKVMTNSEEDFSRLKMCIIQENESLDTIAERYKLTISHLLRYNRLDNERLEEGQILYIPVSGGRSKKHEG